MKYLFILLLMTSCAVKPYDPCEDSYEQIVEAWDRGNYKYVVFLTHPHLEKCSYQSNTIWYISGVSYKNLENYPKAEEHLLRAINFPGKYGTRAIASLTRVLLSQDKNDEAMDWVDVGIKSNDSMAGWYRLKGNIYLNMDKYDEGIVMFNKSLDIEDNTWSYTGLGTAYSWKKDFVKSKENYEIALALEPENFVAKRSLKWIREQMK